MFFQQRFVPGLAIASYLVGDEKTKQIAVIDPTRDVDEYLRIARDNGGLQITHILETHVHADFVSGAVELKSRLNGAAQICCSAMGGAEWTPKYADRAVRDGDEVRLGSIRLRAIHTPGHTPEHLCWALFDDSRSRDTPWLVFTGDFLFVGDVGRPDLLGETQRAALAHELYDSVFRRVASWPDFVEIFPGHGAGSLCGKAIGSRRSSSLGFERRFNASLAQRPEQAWIDSLMKDMPPAPPYFARMKRINVEGPPVLGVTLPGERAIAPAELAEQMRRNPRLLVLDIRPRERFAAAHVPGSLHIELAPNLASWAGWLITPDQPIVLVADAEQQRRDAATQLIRIGLDRIDGHLAGGLETWKAAALPTASLETIPAPSAASRLSASPRPFLLDVRTDSEWRSGHIDGAIHIMLGLLPSRLSELPPDCAILTFCGSGYRSSIAGSLLLRNGFDHVSSIAGGMDAWRSAALPVMSSA